MSLHGLYYIPRSEVAMWLQINAACRSGKCYAAVQVITHTHGKGPVPIADSQAKLGG